MTRELMMELGSFPVLVRDVSAVKLDGPDAEKSPTKQVYQVSMEAVLDAFQLSLLFARVEGHALVVRPAEKEQADAEVGL